MAIRVGIPRGLLFYYYKDLWQNYLRGLGAEVVVSGETSQATLERGGLIDEVCLPVKAAVGHACELASAVDYLFVPRIVSVAAGQYSCPKIIGLPDMVRGSCPKLPPIIDNTINLRQGGLDVYRAVIACGRLLGKNPLTSLSAWYQACWNSSGAAAGRHPGDMTLKVALIGHPYMLNDRQISRDIVGKLADLGVGVVTADSVDPRTAENVTRRLTKRIFWHYCHRLAGAALALMYSLQPLDGMIFLTSFACGPDSLVGETLGRHARHLSLPFMLLTVDEHTAEAGFVTRLEAFTDMLQRRKSKCW